MKYISLAALTLIAASSIVGSANAATGSSKFGSNVSHSCALTVGADGVMKPNLDSTNMDSQNSGGSAGVVTAVTTSGSYSLTAEAPTAFTTKPAAEAGTHTFTAKYTLTGVTTATDVAGATATKLKNGTTNVAVNLKVTTSGDAFANGAYEAAVLVRCE